MMMQVALPLSIIILAIVFAVLRIVKSKNVDIILRGRRRGSGGLKQPHGPRHIFFCTADHFEPLWNRADQITARERVGRWIEQYPSVCGSLRDNGGRPPQHTFFCPAEEYVPEHLDALARLTRKGFGDVEVHLHHDNDTSDGLREKLVTFRDSLHERHGLLRRDPSTGILRYGFIHGNWALDDSGVGGGHCGVKNELSILRETGCYADFTYPSAPHATQPPVINTLYYAKDDPGAARSHHSGTEAAYGSGSSGDLLMVSGPLALNWRKRKRLFFPAIENGDITGLNPPDRNRIDLWVETGIGVKQWPGWVFVKVHTHGAQERNARVLLGERFTAMHDYLLSRYNDGSRYVVHYVTAWELYNCISALVEGDEERIRSIESFDYSLPGGC
jgi:hypothetical protein